MVDQDDLAIRTKYTRAFRQYAFGLLDERDHELTNDAVERRIGVGQFLRIHHRQFLYKWIAATQEPLACACNHRLRDVDADDFRRCIVIIERQSRPDSDFENSAPDLTRG